MKYLVAMILSLLVAVTAVAVPPPLPEHASGNFKIVCQNARLRINTLPFAIATAQCYNVNYTTNISMFANGNELVIPSYGAGQWPMVDGQNDRILDLQIGIFEANSNAGPHLWIMLTDYWNSADHGMWVDLHAYNTAPSNWPRLANAGVPEPLFNFNQMLSEYSPAINSGAQLLGSRTWGVFGSDEWFLGNNANPQFRMYNHGWALTTNLPFANGNGSFNLATLYSANTKIKTTVTNVRQVYTPSINGIENQWDHLGDLVFEIYDDSLPLLRGDFDGSASCDTEDLFCFLNCYFSNSLAADVNNDLDINVGDVFTFLDDWFEGQ
jgi:hypothetical protein